jgi:hypothetical protein
MNDGDAPRTEWPVKLVLILTPAVVIAGALRTWSSPPLAWGVATLVTMLAVYPVPPRPGFGFAKWAGLSLICGLGAALIVLALPSLG